MPVSYTHLDVYKRQVIYIMENFIAHLKEVIPEKDSLKLVKKEACLLYTSSLENGRYNPSIILAFKLARYFNMSIEDIFIYEEGKQ